MQSLVAGAVAGLIATAPMSATMLLLRRLSPETRHGSLPPETVTARAAAAAHLWDDLGEPGLRAATVVGHFAYGAAAGTLYAAVAGSRRHPLTAGVAFGLALWGIGYLGWVPAFGLMPPATEQPAPRNAVMIAAHAVWGATTGLLLAKQAFPADDPGVHPALGSGPRQIG